MKSEDDKKCCAVKEDSEHNIRTHWKCEGNGEKTSKEEFEAAQYSFPWHVTDFCHRNKSQVGSGGKVCIMCLFFLKGHSTNFRHKSQFTHHGEWYSENNLDDVIKVISLWSTIFIDIL